MPTIHFLKIPSNATIMLKKGVYYAIVQGIESNSDKPARIAYVIFWYLHEEKTAKDFLSKYI